MQRGHAVANGLPLLACNRTGFEADPGAQVDRTLMERDPHAILEG